MKRVFGFLVSFLLLLGFFGGWIESGEFLGGIFMALQIAGIGAGAMSLLFILSAIWFGKWWKNE